MNRGSGTTGQNLLFLPKSTLLHQSKAFNAPQLDADLCSQILTAILYQLGQGESFSKEESTSLFFSCTKLFQCKDIFLRRLVYCLIRALHPTPDDAVIIISCLSKDVNSTNNASEVCRSNAVRLLFSLIDDAMIQNIERLLTQTLIDTNPVLIKSSLLAAQHVYRYSVDAVRRWKLEINKSLNNHDQVIAYHALSLATKALTSQNDNLGFTRFVNNNIKAAPSHGKRLLPTIYEIRTISSLMNRQQIQSGGVLSDPVYQVEWLEYLRDVLGDSNHIGIQLESIKVVLKFFLHTNRVDYQQFLSYTVSILVSIVSKQSSTIVHKFAAFRLLNDIAQNKTELLSPHSNQFDALLSTSQTNPILQNRTLAMLAINISLKAGNEGNIEYFLSALENVLASSPDEQKLSILFNLRDYILYKNRHKFVPIISFMSLFLKDENKFIIKNAIITIYQQFLTQLPQSTSLILDIIAEHIEDSEYPRVTLKIINIIGQYACRHPTRPEKYIRYLFNRTMLESASIRATAVSAIVRIGLSTQSFNTNPPSPATTSANGDIAPSAPPAVNKQSKRQIRQTILSLLLTVCFDSDDEVRDRARLYIDLLKRMIGAQSGSSANQTQLQKLTQLHSNPIGLFIDSSKPTSEDVKTIEQNNPHRYLDNDTFPQFPTYPSSFALGGSAHASAEIPTLPDLDALEAGALNYLQSNFNINTTAHNLPPTTPALPTAINPSAAATAQSTPAMAAQATTTGADAALASPTSFFYNDYIIPTSQSPAPLPPPPHRLFDPSIDTQNNPIQPFSSQYVTSLYTTSGANASQSGKSATGAGSATSPLAAAQLQQAQNTGEFSTAQSIEQLTQRGCPAPILAFLNHNNIKNIWNSQFDVNSTTKSQQNNQNSTSQTGSKSTEFPSIINHYIFPNGSILFETTVRHNFTNAIVNGMILQIDELQKLHEQGHISLHCMSTASTTPPPLNTADVASNNNIASPTNAANTAANPTHSNALEIGQTRTFYTFFTIKQLPLLINLCSLQYQYKLRYMVTVDGEIEKGEYPLYRAPLSPQLFIAAPTSYLQTYQHVGVYEWDYKQYWEQLGQNVPPNPNLPAETTMSYTIPLDPALVQNNTNPQALSQLFLQKVTDILNMFQKEYGFQPNSPQFNVQSLAGQTQVLINLFGVYLAAESTTGAQGSNPAKILCRFGCMFQPQNSQIVVKVMLKTHNPHLTKLLASSIKI